MQFYSHRTIDSHIPGYNSSESGRSSPTDSKHAICKSLPIKTVDNHKSIFGCLLCFGRSVRVSQIPVRLGSLILYNNPDPGPNQSFHVSIHNIHSSFRSNSRRLWDLSQTEWKEQKFVQKTYLPFKSFSYLSGHFREVCSSCISQVHQEKYWSRQPIFHWHKKQFKRHNQWSQCQ